MRQAILAGRGEVRVADGELPEPAPGELRVRAESAVSYTHLTLPTTPYV